MNRPLDNNKLSKETLTFSLEHFIEGGEDGVKRFLLKGIKANYEFEDGADGKKHMTEKFLDTDTYSFPV